MNWLKRLMGTKVSAGATADHLELSEACTVLGLKISWFNLTHKPIFINDLELKLYLDGKNQEPRSFSPLERFARVAGQRTFQKAEFTWAMLPPGEHHVEEVRFLYEEAVDIPPGKYRIELEITDLESTRYTVRTDLQINAKIKFRQTEEWSTD